MPNKMKPSTHNVINVGEVSTEETPQNGSPIVQVLASTKGELIKYGLAVILPCVACYWLATQVSSRLEHIENAVMLMGEGVNSKLEKISETQNEIKTELRMQRPTRTGISTPGSSGN